MKKTLIALSLFLSFTFLTDAWNYVISPVNCTVNFGATIIGAFVDLGTCVYNNVTFQAPVPPTAVA